MFASMQLRMHQTGFKKARTFTAFKKSCKCFLKTEPPTKLEFKVGLIAERFRASGGDLGSNPGKGW